jgi:hypothetical protein
MRTQRVGELRLAELPTVSRCHAATGVLQSPASPSIHSRPSGLSITSTLRTWDPFGSFR